MFTIWGNQRSFRGGASRRDFLRVGALGLGGLSLVDLLRFRGRAAMPPKEKAVLTICPQAGPTENAAQNSRRAAGAAMGLVPNVFSTGD